MSFNRYRPDEVREEMRRDDRGLAPVWVLVVIPLFLAAVFLLAIMFPGQTFL